LTGPTARATVVGMPRRLGRYELTRRLGQGGAGEVWAAILHGPAGFRRDVAVKLLRVSADPTQEQALLQEARLGALVSHPNVVTTLELGEAEGHFFIVMERVRGPTATQLASQSTLPASALVDLARQAAEGLAHIHELTDPDGWPLGLVHRDIKPSNLMIDPHGRVKIVDLGIASLVGTGELAAGTVGFAPREQMLGKEEARSDLFALGVTLCKLAIGRMPFGSGAAAGHRILDDEEVQARREAPALHEALDRVVPGFADLVLRCLAPWPEQRWPSARDLAAELRRLQRAIDGPRLDQLVDDATTPAPAPRAPGLTTQRGRFVGRQVQLQTVQELLDDADERWIVVTGPGGVGKSRLVDEATRGHDLVRCDASGVRTLPGLCHAIAHALSATVGREPVRSVGAILANHGPLTLVLDELDRAAEAATEALATWHQMAPQARFLCTSRVALTHRSATLVRLGPMSMDDARALFAARSGRHEPARVVDPLLRRLDRLPLAVELAAARARKRSTEEVLEQLRAHASPQVPTLRHALDDSFGLLGPRLQRSLVLLAAYEGPFDVADAAAVLDAEARDDVVHELSQLVDHSLLAVRADRFRLLASVRSFARERLPSVRDEGFARHGRSLARLGRPDALHTGDPGPPADRLRRCDDLLAASRRAARRGDADTAVATALAAAAGLAKVGPMASVVEVLDEVRHLGLREPEVLRLRGSALLMTGRLRQAGRDLRVASEQARGPVRHLARVQLAMVEHGRGRPHALHMARPAAEALAELGSPWASRALVMVAALQLQARDTAGAEASVDEAEILAHRLGHPVPVGVWSIRAASSRQRSDLTGAVERYRRAIAAAVEAGADLRQAILLVNLADVLTSIGDLEGAVDHAHRARTLARQVGRIPTEGIAHTTLSTAARLRGEPAAAEDHAQAALRLAEEADEDNLSCHAHLAAALVRFQRGDPGLDHLDEAHRLASRATPSVRVVIAAQLARYASEDRGARALEAVADLGNTPYLRAWWLLGRAELAWRRGDSASARRALYEGSALLGPLGIRATAPVAASYQRLRSQLRR